MRNQHALAKSIGIGLAVGGASAMIGGAMMNRSHRRKASAKRTMHQVARTVGNVVDSVQSIMK